jgi:hypothetical protein
MSSKAAFTDLHNTFQTAQGTPPEELVSQIQACNIDPNLKKALCEAASGDNRSLNTWLFSEESKRNGFLAWLAPIKGDGPTYVWMLGYHNEIASIVHSWFDE